MGSLVLTARGEQNWKLPDLNPFDNKTDHNSKPDSKGGSGGFKLPSLGLPSKSSSAPKKPAQPSTWSKMTQGTKDFFGKTKETLMPWTKSSGKSNKNGGSHGSSTFHKTSSKSQGKAEKNSFFANWLSPPEEPQEPRTVPEWLNQSRPEF
jgi:hypothetical protein